MRLPSLVCGLATILVLPLFLRPQVGSRSAVYLSWLLAISPIHIFYSRLARPYSLTLLGTVVAHGPVVVKLLLKGGDL